MKEINIGMLVNTHGLRGEMKVKVFTDFPQLRFQRGQLCICSWHRDSLT